MARRPTEQSTTAAVAGVVMGAATVDATVDAVVDAVGRLTLAVVDLAETQRLSSIAMAEVAREQRITNLIVRSQISTDPAEKAQLMDQARKRMDMARRSSPLQPLS